MLLLSAGLQVKLVTQLCCNEQFLAGLQNGSIKMIVKPH